MFSSYCEFTKTSDKRNPTIVQELFLIPAIDNYWRLCRKCWLWMLEELIGWNKLEPEGRTVVSVVFSIRCTILPALASEFQNIHIFEKFFKYIPLLLRRWYEIMTLYYVKSIITDTSASRQDRRVLQKSKIIRIEFLSKCGMLQTSRYV